MMGNDIKTEYTFFRELIRRNRLCCDFFPLVGFSPTTPLEGLGGVFRGSPLGYVNLWGINPYVLS